MSTNIISIGLTFLIYMGILTHQYTIFSNISIWELYFHTSICCLTSKGWAENESPHMHFINLFVLLFIFQTIFSKSLATVLRIQWYVFWIGDRIRKYIYIYIYKEINVHCCTLKTSVNFLLNGKLTKWILEIELNF